MVTCPVDEATKKIAIIFRVRPPTVADEKTITWLVVGLPCVTVTVALPLDNDVKFVVVAMAKELLRTRWR